MNEYEYERVVPSIDTIILIILGILGVVAGTVLCIFKACAILPNISWFWATFPFWIVPASFVALIVVLFIIGFFYSLFGGND